MAPGCRLCCVRLCALVALAPCSWFPKATLGCLCSECLLSCLQPCRPGSRQQCAVGLERTACPAGPELHVHKGSLTAPMVSTLMADACSAMSAGVSTANIQLPSHRQHALQRTMAGGPCGEGMEAVDGWRPSLTSSSSSGPLKWTLRSRLCLPLGGLLGASLSSTAHRHSSQPACACLLQLQ